MKKIIDVTPKISGSLKELLKDTSLSYTDLSNKLGISKSAVKTMIKKEGLVYAYVNPRYVWESRRTELESLIEQGKNLREIAEYYGYPGDGHENVRLAIKRLGLKYEPKTTEWTDSEISKLREYLDKGLTYSEIASKFLRHTKGNPDRINGFVNSAKGKELGLVYKGDKKNYVTGDQVKTAYDRLASGETSIPRIAKDLQVYPGSLRRNLYQVYGKTVIQGFIGVHQDRKTSSEIHRIFAYGLMTTDEVITRYGITKKSAEGLKVVGLRKYYKEGKITEEEYLRRRFTDKKYENLLRYYGRPPVESELLKPYKDIFTKEYIERLYTSLDYSNSELALALGVSPSVSDRIRRHFGIPFYEGNVSTGERVTLSSIKGLGLSEYKCQVPHRGIASPYRDTVSIDFEVVHNGKVYWIEYNGQQHYSYESFISLTKKNEDYSRFESLLNRDRCIRTYARDNGITLIEIPYTKVTVSGITRILKEVILEGNDAIATIGNLQELHERIKSYGINPIECP